MKKKKVFIALGLSIIMFISSCNKTASNELVSEPTNTETPTNNVKITTQPKTPTVMPTATPTPVPTAIPTPVPIDVPVPSLNPTISVAPTVMPTATPTPSPTPTLVPTPTEIVNVKQQNSIAMLNYLTYLLQEINDSKNSRVFLEDAYSNILNNVVPLSA